jgi:hypothetical protein
MANGYDFRANAVAALDDYSGPFLPYKTDRREFAGLSNSEAERFFGNRQGSLRVGYLGQSDNGTSATFAIDHTPDRSRDPNGSATIANKPAAVAIKPPRLVSYSEGVFMTAGQHKGAMLRILLNKSQRDFDAIVFVDDRDQHVKAVHEAFADQPTREVWTFRYSKEDANAARLNPPDTATAEKVTQQWKALASALTTVNQ